MNTPIFSDYSFLKIPNFRHHNVYKMLFKEDNKINQVFWKKMNFFWNNIYILFYLNTVLVGYTEPPKCLLLTYNLCNVQYCCNFLHRIMFTYPKVNMMVVEFIRGLLFI